VYRGRKIRLWLNRITRGKFTFGNSECGERERERKGGTPATLRCFTCDNDGTCCAHFRLVLFRLGAIRARRRRLFTPLEKFYRVAPPPPRVASSHSRRGSQLDPSRVSAIVLSLSLSLSPSFQSAGFPRRETPESGRRPRRVAEIWRLIATKGNAGGGGGRNKVHARFCVCAFPRFDSSRRCIELRVMHSRRSTSEARRDEARRLMREECTRARRHAPRCLLSRIARNALFMNRALYTRARGHRTLVNPRRVSPEFLSIARRSR